MYKFVVLSAVLAVVAAKPGYLHGGAAIVGPVAHAVPAAVSHSSRTDFISSPVVAHTAIAAAPVLAHTAVAAAPVVAHHVAAAPVVAHAAPVVAHAAPFGVLSHGAIGVGVGVAAPAVYGHAAYSAPIGHLGVGHVKVHQW